MKKKWLFTACCASSLLLLAPSISMSVDIINGSLANALNPGPSAVALDLLFASMNVTMDAVALYYKDNNTCPATGLFLKQPSSGSNVIEYVTNGPNCAVIGQFSSSAPGPLKGKTVRIVIKLNGTNTDFNFRQTVTDTDFSPNGSAPTFLLLAQREFAWAPTLQASHFGNTISTSPAKVMALEYTALERYNQQNAAAASSSASNSATVGSATHNATVKTVL